MMKISFIRLLLLFLHLGLKVEAATDRFVHRVTRKMAIGFGGAACGFVGFKATQGITSTPGLVFGYLLSTVCASQALRVLIDRKITQYEVQKKNSENELDQLDLSARRNLARESVVGTLSTHLGYEKGVPRIVLDYLVDDHSTKELAALQADSRSVWNTEILPSMLNRAFYAASLILRKPGDMNHWTEAVDARSMIDSHDDDKRLDEAMRIEGDIDFSDVKKFEKGRIADRYKDQLRPLQHFMVSPIYNVIRYGTLPVAWWLLKARKSPILLSSALGELSKFAGFLYVINEIPAVRMRAWATEIEPEAAEHTARKQEIVHYRGRQAVIDISGGILCFLGILIVLKVVSERSIHQTNVSEKLSTGAAIRVFERLSGSLWIGMHVAHGLHHFIAPPRKHIRPPQSLA